MLFAILKTGKMFAIISSLYFNAIFCIYILYLAKHSGFCTFDLGTLAYTRSGDKGNNANIG